MEWQDKVEYYLKIARRILRTERQLLRTDTRRVSKYMLDIALDYVEMVDRIVSEIEREQTEGVRNSIY